MVRKEIITSILFADIVGYSKITEDYAKESFQKGFKGIINSVFTEEKHFYKNTWGDALFVCSTSCFNLAESALKFRDAVRVFNWKRYGIVTDVGIRIGLHIQKIITNSEDGKVVEVTGKGIDLTARIEPIVEPNHVYCSSRFYDHLMDEDSVNIIGNSIGKQKLAKDYGEMDLYDIYWDTESPKPSHTKENPSVHLPKIRREFSDKEKRAFLNETYHVILSYFEQASKQLCSSDKRIEVDLQKPSKIIFVFRVYIDGDEKSKCKIWLTEGGFMSNQIAYSESFSQIFNDTGMNDSASIEHDGFELSLKVLGLGIFGGQNNPTKERMSPKEVAEYFWKRVIQKLEY
ncbi:MAG: hypothetical protein KKA84_16300 [Bacteroidetes bacterium]|nr:hypothetical protein [Bacteroidota bacterium]